MISEFRNDLRHGARALRNNPGFTVIAIVSLAFGIGANTAMFNILDAWHLGPLPFKDPEKVASSP